VRRGNQPCSLKAARKLHGRSFEKLRIRVTARRPLALFADLLQIPARLIGAAPFPLFSHARRRFHKPNSSAPQRNVSRCPLFFIIASRRRRFVREYRRGSVCPANYKVLNARRMRCPAGQECRFRVVSACCRSAASPVTLGGLMDDGENRAPVASEKNKTNPPKKQKNPAREKYSPFTPNSVPAGGSYLLRVVGLSLSPGGGGGGMPDDSPCECGFRLCFSFNL